MPGYRILIVDDHADTLAVLSRLLRSEGHDVCLAATAEGAMECISRQEFDLLLVDLGLPDRDGRDLLRQARASCAAPAIALTGFGMEADAESCKAAGFARHLVKPIAFDGLLSALEELRPIVPAGSPHGCAVTAFPNG